MAFYDEDFQSYAIGSFLPLGNFTPFGLGVIVAGGPSGTDRSLSLINIAQYDRGSGYLASFSEFVAVNKTSGGVILQFLNGPNGGGATFNLVEVGIENDSTVTATCPTDNLVLGNSLDELFVFNSWNFFQVNITLTDALNSGVLCVNIAGEIALNGRSILTFNKLTNVAVSQLTNGTSEVNKFNLATNSCLYDAYTLDSLQPIVSYPHPGTPSALVLQGVIELGEEPDDANVQVFQGATELALLPDSAKIIDYQGVIELLITRGKTYISES